MDTMKSANTRPTGFATRTQEAYFEASKVHSEINLLIKERRKKEVDAEKIEEAFKKSYQQNFYGFAVDFAMFLLDYFITKGKGEKVDKYGRLALKCNEIMNAENIAKIKYKSISLRLNQTRKPEEQLLKDLSEICEELKPFLNYDSATIWTYTFSLLNLQASIQENYLKIIAQSWKAIEYFREKGIHRELPFYKDIAFANIAIGEYEAALDAIEKASLIARKRTEIWSIFVYYKVIINLHQRKYQEAYNIFADARDKKYLSKEILRKEIVEQWDVVKGYLKFLVQSGKVEGSTQFKIGKFINDIEVFKKDRSGQIVNVLILKIILRLHSDRGVDVIIKESEAIQKYAQRYLAAGSRPRLFFPPALPHF